MVGLDYETRSMADLKVVGSRRYAVDPTTSVICAAVDQDIYIPGYPELSTLTEEQFIGALQGQEVHAFNAGFEAAITERFWPQIKCQWVCTQALAASYSLPRKLEKVVEVLGLPAKASEGRRLIQRYGKPGRDIPLEDMEAYRAYCLQDVSCEQGIRDYLPPLSDYERRIWQLDFKMNRRGVKIDVDLAESVWEVIGRYNRELADELHGLIGVAPTQVAKIVSWINSSWPEYQLADLKKETISALLDQELPELLRRVLNIRRFASRTSTKKFKTMLARQVDGRLYNNLLFYGAATGRWSGQGVQLQNLPRESLGAKEDEAIAAFKSRDLEAVKALGEPTTLAAKLIRPTLMADDGHDLIAGDFASIEARVLMWVARDPGLELFRAGKNLYCEMAEVIYGRPIDKHADPVEYVVGKAAVLGLGYQMGWKKFLATCEKSGIVLDAALAQKVVTAYRQKFVGVPLLWNGLEEAAIRCVMTKEQTEYGMVRFARWRKFLLMRLPSGRSIKYFMPHLVDGKLAYYGTDSKTKQWTTIYTYGGKLTENLVQGIARDLMADSLLRLDEAGYSPVLTVHDEDVSEVPEGWGSEEELAQIMEVCPPWAEGLPIKVETFRQKRYKK